MTAFLEKPRNIAIVGAGIIEKVKLFKLLSYGLSIKIASRLNVRKKASC
jgi:hypothetical protein